MIPLIVSIKQKQKAKPQRRSKPACLVTINNNTKITNKWLPSIIRPRPGPPSSPMFSPFTIRSKRQKTVHHRKRQHNNHKENTTPCPIRNHSVVTTSPHRTVHQTVESQREDVRNELQNAERFPKKQPELTVASQRVHAELTRQTADDTEEDNDERHGHRLLRCCTRRALDDEVSDDEDHQHAEEALNPNSDAAEQDVELRVERGDLLRDPPGRRFLLRRLADRGCFHDSLLREDVSAV